MRDPNKSQNYPEHFCQARVMTFRAKVSLLYTAKALTKEKYINKLNVSSSIHAKKVAFIRLWLSISSNVIALGWSTVHSGAAGSVAAVAARHSSSTTTHRRSDGGGGSSSTLQFASLPLFWLLFLLLLSCPRPLLTEAAFYSIQNSS